MIPEATVGVRELKNRLSALLRRAAEGERITITDRGRPLAILGPAEPKEDDVVATMVREGSASWGGGKSRGSARPVRIKGRPISETILEWERYVRIEITEPLVVNAADLAERHRLRAYDALHLASVLILAARAADPPTFCCWDGDLLAAASREGLALLRVS